MARQLRVDVGQRQRQAHVADDGMRRAHGDVQHVGARRSCCSARLLPNPCSRAAITSGRASVVLERAELDSVCVESPTTRPSSAMSVTRLGDESRRAIGLASRSGASSGRGLREQVGDELRLVAQAPLDERRAAARAPATPAARASDQQRQRGRGECPDEDFGAEAGLHVEGRPWRQLYCSSSL